MTLDNRSLHFLPTRKNSSVLPSSSFYSYQKSYYSSLCLFLITFLVLPLAFLLPPSSAQTFPTSLSSANHHGHSNQQQPQQQRQYALHPHSSESDDDINIESEDNDEEDSTTDAKDESLADANSQPLFYAVVANAVESGVNEATNLYENIEPHLYKEDLVITGDHPSVYLAAINRQTPRAKELARVAYATLKATTVLKEQLAQFRDEREHPISEISLRNTPLQRSNCPTKRQLQDECTARTRHYRTVDGTCNNLKNPHFGSSFQPFSRFLPPEYDDGVSTIRKSVSGKELPSARLISTTVHKDVSKPSATFTLMVMQWGQFLDHDLTATSQTRSFNHSIPKCCHVAEKHPDCMTIPVPPNDPYFKNNSDCMEFIRSSPAPRVDCTLGPREQLNQLTSWLDGSVLYGSTKTDLEGLRLYTKAHLRYSHMPNRKALLPRLVHPPEGECLVGSPRLYCFAAGDARVNEQPGLTTMHTLWLRQHNIVADKLAAINPDWGEEVLFQETRKIIIAQIQHITFREFLPLLLGPDVMKVFGLRLLKSGYYDGYNESLDPTIASSFAAAAFRFGHSLVQPQIHRCNEAHREMPHKVNLSLELMSPSNLHNLGEVDRISLGLASQRSQKRDEFITSQLTNHLFQTQGHKGLDLAAINIQRGRDHGLPPYLKWRDACGLNKLLPNNQSIVTWDDFSAVTDISAGKVAMLSTVYESPWDIDLFPGAMVEYPVKGGIVGPTFACIIAQTLRNLRRGDRFWFENPDQFTPIQLSAIRNTSLARLLCDTSDAIVTMQPIVFLAPHDQKNRHTNCTDFNGIPTIDFSSWKRQPFSEHVRLDSPLLQQLELEDENLQQEPTFYSGAELISVGSTDDDDDDTEISLDDFRSVPPDYLEKLKFSS